MIAQQSGAPPLIRINGKTFSAMIRASLTWLHTNHHTVNSLNVFPIPDGDTGTNMLLTMQAACDALEDTDSQSVAAIADILAEGALMGARGNSGVILSQILRGLARGLKDLEECDTREFAKAMLCATDDAYHSVLQPVEGTILTVINDASTAATSAAEKEDDFRDYLHLVTSACERSVNGTPNLLPVLKEAGVVDAGGFGLQLLFEGMLRHLLDKPLDVAPERDINPLDLARIENALETVEPNQDWEVVLDLHPQQGIKLDAFYELLQSMGTSIQVGEGDDFIRVHIHLTAENRFKPIECAEAIGAVSKVHMENLLHQMEQQVQKVDRQIEWQPGQLLAVTVSPGPGFTRIFAAPAVAVLHGGQTMNPSIQDILSTFEDHPTDEVIILPNNTNVILAAKEAARISTKQVCVIPTITSAQGAAALVSFDPDGSFDNICAAMKAGAKEVVSLEITTATRSTKVADINIREGQIIGLHNGEITCNGETPPECVLEMLNIIGMDDFDLVTLYYGKQINQDDADSLQSEIQAVFPQLEVESYWGGQLHYHYNISIE